MDETLGDVQGHEDVWTFVQNDLPNDNRTWKVPIVLVYHDSAVCQCGHDYLFIQ
jgi:hypothetical protein